MGSYDSFTPIEPMACPFCGKPELHEFQTKELERYLRRFEIGDKLNEDGDYVVIADGLIPVYELCHSCEAWVEAYAVIHENYFIGFVDIGGEGSKAKMETENK